jgi:hypothetical protein
MAGHNTPLTAHQHSELSVCRLLLIYRTDNSVSCPCVHGHVARMGEGRDAYRVLGRNLREKEHLEDTGVDGGILRRIFRNWDVGVWIRSIWLWVRAGGGLL